MTDIILSLTSHPKRINIVHLTIESLLKQTLKIDKIILYLGETEFPNKENDLPKELLLLCKNNFEIKWCKDIKSYKKLIYALKEYKDSIIITVDDDCIYDENMALNLYSSYLDYPNCIHSLAVSRFYYYKKDKLSAINTFKMSAYGGEFDVNIYKPSAFNKIVGAWGVLYPPNSLHDDIYDLKTAFECCPHNDDLWFHFQALRKGYRVVSPKRHTSIKSVIPDSQDVGLCRINTVPLDKQELCLFDIELKNLYEKYPDVKHIFKIDNKENQKIFRKIKIKNFIKNYLFSFYKESGHNIVRILGIKMKFKIVESGTVVERERERVISLNAYKRKFEIYANKSEYKKCA